MKIPIEKINKLENNDINYSEQIKTFSEYFLDGEIEEIEMNNIPERAMKYFEGDSRKFILPDEYRSGNFEKFFVIKHKNDTKTFLAQQTKTYDDNENTEKLTYIIDIDKDGTYVGHGEIRFNVSNPSESSKNKPFIGYTRTLKGYKKRGLGTRRLYLMNAISQMLYGLSLNSGTSMETWALMEAGDESLWKKLVIRGDAKKFKEGKKNRYVFLTKIKSKV